MLLRSGPHRTRFGFVWHACFIYAEHDFYGVAGPVVEVDEDAADVYDSLAVAVVGWADVSDDGMRIVGGIEQREPRLGAEVRRRS